MNERNYRQRNKKSKKAQETEQSCTISKESFFIALYPVKLASQQLRKKLHRVHWPFSGSIINSFS